MLLSLLGTAIAARRRAHLGLTILTDVVSPKVRRILHIIGYLFAVAFTGAIFYYGIRMVLSQQWPEWIYGSFLPNGALFAAIRFVQVLIEEIRETVEKGGEN